MLVLSRQRDESIVIGDDVVVTVVDIRGDKVRLGIEAPGNVSVHRKEIWLAIQRDQRAAVATCAGSDAAAAPAVAPDGYVPGKGGRRG